MKLPATRPTSLRNRKLLVASGAIILLAIALIVIVGQLGHHETGGTDLSSERSAATAAGFKAFQLSITDGKLTGGPSTITVNKGDKVQIFITSNPGQEEGDVRLAAYGLNSGIEGKSIGAFEFTADKSGTFPLEVRQEAHSDSAAEAVEQETEDQPWMPLATLVVK